MYRLDIDIPKLTKEAIELNDSFCNVKELNSSSMIR